MYFSTYLPLCLFAITAFSAEVTTEHLKQLSCTRRSQAGDTIEVHYRGTFASSGEKFDASYDRGTPLSFTVGQGQVIKGWDDGLLGMCIGDQRKLTIPPELAYGDRDMGPIPAGSTLVFETELVGIAGVEEKGAEKEKEL